MQRDRVLLIGVGALVAFVAALPLEWMTIQNAVPSFEQPSNSFLTLSGMTISVTGLSGHITLGAKIPSVLVVFSGFCVIAALVIGLDSPDARLGVGGLVAFAGVGLAGRLALADAAPTPSPNELA